MSACAGCGAELAPSGRRPRKWCSEVCRRHTVYSRPCRGCGRPTYNGTAHPPERCVSCTGAASRIWTRETVIAAIRAWADETGGIPPRATDWNATIAGHREPRFPSSTTVQYVFGSWNAAIRAAGFDPRRVGRYGRDGEDPALCQEIRERYEAGESSLALGDEYDCHPQTISYRVRKAGGTMRPAGRPRRQAVPA